MMEPIFKYTRADALRDGVLVDVTSVAKECGFAVPVAFTSAVFEGQVRPSQPGSVARLTNLLGVMRAASRALPAPSDRVDFTVDGTELYALCHPGDFGEPVITIMEIGED
jgi:hypothetical protein